MAEDCFALFGLAPAFGLDMAALADRYRALAGAVHPDRFVGAPVREQRLAQQRTADLNDAWQTLKDPVRRARHLLALQGHELPEEATVQDPEFLQQQMAWREELETLRDTGDRAGLVAFRHRLGAARQALEAAFSAAWSQSGQPLLAERLVRRMQFLARLEQELRRLDEQLDENED